MCGGKQTGSHKRVFSVVNMTENLRIVSSPLNRTYDKQGRRSTIMPYRPEKVRNYVTQLISEYLWILLAGNEILAQSMLICRLV